MGIYFASYLLLSSYSPIGGSQVFPDLIYQSWEGYFLIK